MKISCPNCNIVIVPSIGTHTCECERFLVSFNVALEICYYFFFFSESTKKQGVDVLVSDLSKPCTFYNKKFSSGQIMISKFILPKEFTISELLKIKDKISKLSKFM